MYFIHVQCVLCFVYAFLNALSYWTVKRHLLISLFKSEHSIQVSFEVLPFKPPLCRHWGSVLTRIAAGLFSTILGNMKNDEVTNKQQTVANASPLVTPHGGNREEGGGGQQGVRALLPSHPRFRFSYVWMYATEHL